MVDRSVASRRFPDRPDGGYRVAFRADAASIGPAASGGDEFLRQGRRHRDQWFRELHSCRRRRRHMGLLVSGVHDWAAAQTAAVNIDPTRVSFSTRAVGGRGANVFEGSPGAMTSITLDGVAHVHTAANRARSSTIS